MPRKQSNPSVPYCSRFTFILVLVLVLSIAVLLGALTDLVEWVPESAFQRIPAELAAPLRTLFGSPFVGLVLSIPLTDWTVPLIRAAQVVRYHSLYSPPAPQPVEYVVGHGVRIFVFDPQIGATNRAAFLHLHGGGYVMGHPFQRVNNLQDLALDCKCVVASVQYRRAPEYQVRALASPIKFRRYR
jgi:acetyl esterase/lipase